MDQYLAKQMETHDMQQLDAQGAEREDLDKRSAAMDFSYHLTTESSRTSGWSVLVGGAMCL